MIGVDWREFWRVLRVSGALELLGFIAAIIAVLVVLIGIS